MTCGANARPTSSKLCASSANRNERPRLPSRTTEAQIFFEGLRHLRYGLGEGGSDRATKRMGEGPPPHSFEFVAIVSLPSPARTRVYPSSSPLAGRSRIYPTSGGRGQIIPHRGCGLTREPQRASGRRF